MVIRRWAGFPRELLDTMEPDGDFCRRHLLNPVLLRMLGEVRGLPAPSPRSRFTATRPSERRSSRWVSATFRQICAGCPILAARSTPS